MNNVLLSALNPISTLIPLQKVSIENNEVKIVKGIPVKSPLQSIECKAHIQARNPANLKIGEGGTQESTDLYDVWLLGDNLSLIYQKLKINKESYLIWGNKRCKIYAKNDYSLNGWIECEMSTVGYVDV